MTTGVYLDEATTDPSQRYKISTGTNGAGGIATSPDGLTWTNNKDLEKMTHARWDTPKNTVWDPINKQCMYTRARTRVCVYASRQSRRAVGGCNTLVPIERQRCFQEVVQS